MKPTIIASRAVTAEFARRTLRPFLLLSIIICAVLVIGGGYLVSLSAWWWLLQISFIFTVLLIVIILLVVGVIVRTLAPKLTKPQKLGTKEFVDKLQRVTDSIGTPKLILLYRIIRDSLQKRQNGFIEAMSRDSSSLQSDFIALVRLFTPK